MPLAAPFGVFGRSPVAGVRGACNDRSRLGESASEPLPSADGGLLRMASLKAWSISASGRGLGVAPATLGPSEFRGRREAGVGMPVAGGMAPPGAGERFGVDKVGRRDIAIALLVLAQVSVDESQDQVVVGAPGAIRIIERM